MNGKGKLWKYGNGYKDDGKKVHSDSLFQFNHQFQKLTLKCHNTSFLSHLWLQLSRKFKRGFKLLGHFSSHEHLSYGCRGSNLHNVNCHEVMTYASGAQQSKAKIIPSKFNGLQTKLTVFTSQDSKHPYPFHMVFPQVCPTAPNKQLSQELGGTPM